MDRKSTGFPVSTNLRPLFLAPRIAFLMVVFFAIPFLAASWGYEMLDEFGIPLNRFERFYFSVCTMIWRWKVFYFLFAILLIGAGEAVAMLAGEKFNKVYLLASCVVFVLVIVLSAIALGRPIAAIWTA